MRSSTVAALAASLSTVSATAYKGFNYGAVKADGYTPMTAQDFENSFKLAKSITPDGSFTSARVYTMIQAGTAKDPLSAIDVAFNMKVPILLGMWASDPTDPAGAFSNQLDVLKSVVAKYGSDAAQYVVGISVGSEDLYRNSPMGIAAKEGAGNQPANIADYIKQTKSFLSGSPWNGVKVGHVDTSTAWANDTNAPVWEAADWVGQDSYPFWQSTDANSIDNAVNLWNVAYEATKAHTGKADEDIWATETGWAVKGSTQNQAVPNAQNAKTYFDNVGCDILFGKVNTWWFSLQVADSTEPTLVDAAGNPVPDFSVVDPSGKAYYNLTCDAAAASSSSSSSASSASSTASSSSSSSGSSSSASQTGSSPKTTTTGTSTGNSSPKGGNSGSSASGTGSAQSTGSAGSSSGSGSSSGENGTVVPATLSTATTPGHSSTASPSSGSGNGSGNVTTNGANTLSGSMIAVAGVVAAALFAL